VATEAADRRRALVAMQAAYAQAVTVADKKPAAQTYALGNRLAADVVLSWSSRRRAVGTAITDGLKTYKALADELVRTSTDYFDLSARADHLLLTALARRAMTAAERESVRRAYDDAGLRGVAPRHRLSLRDQLEFFASMAQKEFSPRDGARLAAGLDELRRQIGDGGSS
jgi:hypothetical protein